MYKLSIIILGIIMMGIIFLFSSYDATISSLQSQYITNFINKIIPIESSVVRDLAHFGLFFMLELIVYIGMKICAVKRPELYSVIFVSMFAITDELHQYFVPGRSCQVHDVILDICGSLCALLIIK